MLHVLTVHFQSDAWIEPQLRYIERFAPAQTRVWACLNGIDDAYASRFSVAVDLEGTHPQKLNQLAEMVLAEADPDDHLLFIDGDAFPVRPLAPLLADPIALIAARRAENFGDPQPHPCFSITTARFWREIGGDWRAGFKWENSLGLMVTDPGANLLQKLQEREIAWRPLDRVNTVNLHPLWFALYGDDEYGPVVYHHGAGFRGRIGRVDTMSAGFAFDAQPRRRASRIPGLRRVERHLRGRISARRRAKWEREELPPPKADGGRGVSGDPRRRRHRRPLRPTQPRLTLSPVPGQVGSSPRSFCSACVYAHRRRTTHARR